MLRYFLHRKYITEKAATKQAATTFIFFKFISNLLCPSAPCSILKQNQFDLNLKFAFKGSLADLRSEGFKFVINQVVTALILAQIEEQTRHLI